MTRLSVVAAVVVALVVVGGSGVSFGTPLGLTKTFPDIDSFFDLVVYTPGSPGTLTVDGIAASLTLVPAGIHHNILPTDIDYHIVASVDSSGNASGGSLTITGSILDLGIAGPVLLTGTLDKFGFPDPPGGQTLEFLFRDLGGDLAPYYGGEAGVILDMNQDPETFDGTFTQPFNNNLGGYADGNADTFPVVPEPASAVLVLLGLAAMGYRSRR